MGKYSRDKGARGERALKAALNSAGLNTDRGFFIAGEADLIGLNGIHVECKAVEKLNIWEAMKQAEEDAVKMQDGFPAVFHKRNYTGFLVTMKLENWIELYKGWQNDIHSRVFEQAEEERDSNG